MKFIKSLYHKLSDNSPSAKITNNPRPTAKGRIVHNIVGKSTISTIPKSSLTRPAIIGKEERAKKLHIEQQ